MTTLKKGAKGAEVEVLQRKLTALGYPCGAPDGVFGALTLAAVKAYQKDNKLTVDGIVGPQTWGALLAGVSAGAKEPKSPHFSLAEMNVHDKALEYLWEPLPVKYYANAQALLDNFLEPLRAAANAQWAGPGEEVQFILRGGYRCAAYNKKVGGADGSWHLDGSAADIYAQIVRQSSGVLVRRPNDYQLAKLAWALFKHGGFGLGSNTNLHIDTRYWKTYWWYNYKSWAAWQAGQGPAA